MLNTHNIISIFVPGLDLRRMPYSSMNISNKYFLFIVIYMIVYIHWAVATTGMCTACKMLQHI